MLSVRRPFHKLQSTLCTIWPQYLTGSDDSATVDVQVEQLNSTDASTRHKVAACVRELEGEIRTLQKLRHPNIVQYLGFERTDTHFNIFLEWMPGGSIRKLLDDFGVPRDPACYLVMTTIPVLWQHSTTAPGIPG
jgi:serine/threonine protein kinase